MKIRKIAYFLGRILIAGAFVMALPITVALIYKEYSFIPSFLISAGAVLAIGAALIFTNHKKAASLSPKEGMAVAALTWLVLSVMGALPSVISPAGISFTDAFFETVSGYTTTGASVLTAAELDSLPRCIIFWRSLTHWVGGLGILAFAVAVLPKDKAGNREGSAAETLAVRAESPGPTFGKLVSKLKFNSQLLYLIYLVLTVLEVILLVCGSMPLFDSICNSFATMGSGGFSMSSAGVSGYAGVTYANAAYIEWVIGVFMVLAGVNFNFYYFLLIRRFAKSFAMEEVRSYIAVIVAAVALISVNVSHMYGSVLETVRHAFFQVASIISTTGFATVDFDLWPEFSKVILVLLMFIGGCAGSTGGGIKISRIVIMLKTGFKEIRYHSNPREIRSVQFDKQPIDRTVISGVSSYFVVYMIIFAISLLIISLDNHDFTTTFTAVASCFNNIGPGLSKVGPSLNFSCMSSLSEYVLSFNMLLGRLEIFPILVLLSPRSWKK